MRLFVGLTALCALASAVSAQSWVLGNTGHGELFTNGEQVNAWTATETKTWNWEVWVSGYFRVSGSATQSPPWSGRFANLCDNFALSPWQFTRSLQVNDLVTNFTSYYTRNGFEEWVSGSVTVRRDASEKVTEDVWYTVTPGGGGS